MNTKKALFSVVFLSILGLILRSNSKNPDHYNTIDHYVLKLTQPLQRGITYGINQLTNGFSRYVLLVRVQEENEKLREKNTFLQLELENMKLFQKNAIPSEEWAQLAKQYKIPIKNGIYATVIQAKTSSYFRVISIALMLTDGEKVQVGMPVVSTQGLVGMIEQVSGNYATVRLVIDPGFKVEVNLERTNARGVLRGSSSADRYGLSLENLKTSQVNQTAQIGDRVITSGIGMPFGILVGFVSKIRSNNPPLPQQVELTPSVNFNQLRHVLIIPVVPPLINFELGQPVKNKKNGR